MVKTYTENPSFSNKKNLEETEQLLDEVWTLPVSVPQRQVATIIFFILVFNLPLFFFVKTTLKLDLLRATHGKLSAIVAEIDGKAKSLHKFSDSITKWKDKVRDALPTLPFDFWFTGYHADIKPLN